MTSDQSKFAKLNSKTEGFVTYGDNNKEKILRTGAISNESSFNIKDVLLVEGLKHNLISISQLYDKGYKVVFKPSHCLIFYAFDNIVLIGNNLAIYTCLICIMHHISYFVFLQKKVIHGYGIEGFVIFTWNI